jgi:hypothetical protein
MYLEFEHHMQYIISRYDKDTQIDRELQALSKSIVAAQPSLIL